MDELQRQNNISSNNLVNSIIIDLGNAQWDKSLVQINKSSNGAVFSKKTGSHKDTMVIVPLLRENDEMVHSYIEAKVDKVISIKIIKDDSYRRLLKKNEIINKNKAEDEALIFMDMTRRVLGTEKFRITDKRLFSTEKSSTDSGRLPKIEFLTNNSLMERHCVQVTVEIECIPQYYAKNGKSIAKDNIHIIYGCFHIYEKCGWYEGGGSNGDGSDGGGYNGSGNNGGDGNTGSGGGTSPVNDDPCNGGGLIINGVLPPLDCGGTEGPGWLPTVPEEIIPPSEQQLLNALANNPFAFFKDIPCEIIKAWLNTAKHKVAQAQIDKLNTLRKKQLIGPVIPFAPPITSEMVASVQTLDGAYSAVVNMDYFAVNVDVLPYTTNGRLTPDQFLALIRRDIDKFVDTDYSTFTPYKWYGINDTDLWKSENPIGAVIAIDIKNIDNGSVIVSGSSKDKWTFTTIKEPKYGGHPVSGNRDFGYIQNPNGSYTFYTRGVDRLTDFIGSSFQKFTEFISGKGYPFKQADLLWTSFQEKISQFVNDNHGISTILPQQIHRPNYSQLKAVIEGHISMSILSKDCPD